MRFRPLDDSTWPGTFTVSRERSPFSAGWNETLALLHDETRHLGADPDDVLVEVALDERHLSVSGDRFLANSPEPRHPGVIVSFPSDVGPLRFACDRFGFTSYRGGPAWKANVRAVALGLEALRKVDRYGVTRRHEQYRGWQELPPSTEAPPPEDLTPEWATTILLAGAGRTARRGQILEPAEVAEVFRAAARNHHPDRGGDPVTFARLVQARAYLSS